MLGRKGPWEMCGGGMAASFFCMESASADGTPEVLLWVLGGPLYFYLHGGQ